MDGGWGEGRGERGCEEGEGLGRRGWDGLGWRMDGWGGWGWGGEDGFLYLQVRDVEVFRVYGTVWAKKA